MGTEIKVWQITDKKLIPINTLPRDENISEPYDIEPWIASDSSIIGNDIVIIGRQVMTDSGPLDLLGIDKNGNLVIIEIKRDKLPREALAQAIDYASDVADWSIEKITETLAAYLTKASSHDLDINLEDYVRESLHKRNIDIENLDINYAQRIILIGFSVESALERMIKWLSDNSNIFINAIVLNYIKTSSGDKLLAKTSIVSEEIEKQKLRKGKPWDMTDKPPPPDKYNDVMLREVLSAYLSIPNVTNKRIKDILLPTLLRQQFLTQEELKNQLLKAEPDIDPSKAGYSVSSISTQLGLRKNDFLRLIVAYKKVNWVKTDYSLRDEYKDLVRDVLKSLEINNITT